MSVAVSRLERVNGRGVVYAGTEPSALFRSEDGGETWQLQDLMGLPSASEWSYPPHPETHHVRWIQPDLHIEGKLFAAIEAGALIRSFDGGKSWQDRTPDSPRDTHQLAMHLSAPGRLYSAAGDGYFESRDGGDTWSKLAGGLGHTYFLRHNYVWSVAVDAGDPDNVIVSAAASARHAHDEEKAESFIYRRHGDAPWQQVCAGLPQSSGRRTAALAAHPSEPVRFFVVWEREVYHSRDGGGSWNPLNVPWPPGFEVETLHSIAISPAE